MLLHILWNIFKRYGGYKTVRSNNLCADSDRDSEKKPRLGQVLWIRGFTRVQTQVMK